MWKTFFLAFKIPAICLQICPGDWDLVWSPAKLFVTSHCIPGHIWCCIEVHNVTSRSDIACDFGRAMTGTNLTANCAYLESKNNAFHIFPAILKLRNVFYRYPTTRNKRKKLCVICITLCLLFIGNNKLQVRNLRMEGRALVGQYKVNQSVQPQRYTVSNGARG